MQDAPKEKKREKNFGHGKHESAELFIPTCASPFSKSLHSILHLSPEERTQNMGADDGGQADDHQDRSNPKTGADPSKWERRLCLYPVRLNGWKQTMAGMGKQKTLPAATGKLGAKYMQKAFLPSIGLKTMTALLDLAMHIAGRGCKGGGVMFSCM